jgi:Holliday junction resolvase
VSGYSEGRRVEYAAIDYLRANGYDTVRAASSKGLADVVAIKPGQVLLVNCKRTTMPGPSERADLLRIAASLPGVGVPLVALHPRREPLTFRRLTGAGPKDWTPWTPDDIEDIA